MAICEGPGPCEKEAARDGFCWAHLKQLERKGRMTALRAPPLAGLEGILEAAREVWEADDEDDGGFRRRHRRFVEAVNRHVASELEALLQGGGQAGRAARSTTGRRMRR